MLLYIINMHTHIATHCSNSLYHQSLPNDKNVIKQNHCNLNGVTTQSFHQFLYEVGQKKQSHGT